MNNKIISAEMNESHKAEIDTERRVREKHIEQLY